ncbi:MAG: glycine cleavage system aminomethyltransferase GcvT [SAR202 cluster bacterium]|nr:glycine cleavage system aminomethyltransferase GcvT [SAR202 cluster bacterium]
MRHTPLFDTHVELGARMVPFGNWEMPVQFGGILNEARAVRTNAGLFDVSHMGRVEIGGPDAAGLLNRVLSVDVTKVRRGRARYNVVCDLDGGIIDDCIVFRRIDDSFLLIPNAANTSPVLDWLRRWSSASHVDIVDVTENTAMIAIQGPEAQAMLQAITDADLATLRPFAAVNASILGVKAFVARTGYTGEAGFELIVPSESSRVIWLASVERGAAPCGLGARDVLRLEAGLALHGADIDTSTNPYEAGLERFVDADRDEYVAGPALRHLRDQAVGRKLTGIKMIGRGIARQGHTITDGHHAIGKVTSGGPSPTLDTNIGLGYVPTDVSVPGTTVFVDIRGRQVEAETTTIPFYSRRLNS